MRRRRLRRALVGGLALVLGAGTVLAFPSSGANARPEKGGAKTPVDGVWRTEGYSTLVSVNSGKLRAYDITARSCIPGFDVGDQAGGVRPDGSVRFADDTDGVVIEPTSTTGRARIRADGSVGYRTLHRIDRLPGKCRTAPSKDPRTTFDVFWRTFDENYPFFEAKGLDWKAVGDKYRGEVDEHTTDDELFETFSKMLRPLRDAHVFLNSGDRFFYEVRPGTRMPDEPYSKRIRAYIERRDFGGKKLRSYANGRIGVAEVSDGIRYLQITGFAGYADGGIGEQADALDRALDDALRPGMRGLILDLRVNGGGSDQLGLQLAGRLTKWPYQAYSKRIRNEPHDASAFTEPQPISVIPSADDPPYTGPIAVLTGGSSVSAAETFTQAMMGRSPAPIRIGQNTQGVFSDVMTRKLPNGWTLGLPNEEFLDEKGKTYDGTGIPPQIRTQVFTDEEFEENRDSAFDKALGIL